jgi:site-specific recombinase XerD
LSHAFEQILEEAGIDNTPIVESKGKGRSVKPYGFHSFRHTFKTTPVNAGVEVQTVDVLTGHAKKTVSETYIHRSIDLLRQVMAKYPHIFPCE